MGEWAIIPDEIVEAIKDKCSKLLKKEATPERVFDLLTDYIDSKPKGMDEALFEKYKILIEKIKPETIKRALNGRSDNGVSLEKNERLLDLLCWCIFDKNWKNTLSDFGIAEDEVIIRISGSNNSESTKFQNTPNDHSYSIQAQETFFVKPFYFQLLDKIFWDKYILTDQEERVRKFSRYFTHTDSTLALYAIANDEIVKTNDVIEVIDSDGNKDEKTIGQILDLAHSQSFSLLKVISDGGIGKTTFLLSIAHIYHESYTFITLDQLTKDILGGIIKEVTVIAENSEHPLVIIIDNIADEIIADSLLKFIKEIKRLDVTKGVTFIFAERSNRYAALFEDNKIDQLFNGNVQSVNHVPLDKEALFKKIYSWFAAKYPQLQNKAIEGKCKLFFFNKPTLSISERTFQLIINLQLNYDIHYDFDWDDWNKFVGKNSQFSNLKDLFVIVACFYQFGIKLKMTFKSSYLEDTDRREIIRAINILGIEKSPIILKDNNLFLALKHEYIGTWFCRFNKNSNLVQRFFRDFLYEIQDITSAKLLRKIRKVSRLDEFKASCLCNEFTPAIYLNVIENYLSRPNLPEEEYMKMLNEKGMALVAIGNKDDAIQVFNEATRLNPRFNHARDQLARIYSKNQSTWQLALNTYLEIYNNKGAYALFEIYKLVREARLKNLPLEYSEKSLSTQEANNLAKKCILSNEYSFADEILTKIELPDMNTADCCNLLANAFSLSNENISLKNFYYKKAIDIQRSLHSQTDQFKYEMDYAVFLYSIRDFDKSTKIVNSLNKRHNLGGTPNARDLFNTRTRGINRLIFRDIPPKEQINALKKYLLKQTKDAAALIKHNITEISTIIKGILILNTVRYYSFGILPDIFNEAGIQLGYAYSAHAEKQLYNLSAYENRVIAENFFDKAFQSSVFFSFGDCNDMLRNLMLMNDKLKSTKALNLANLLLENPSNRIFPGFYRQKGKALAHLGRFQEGIDNFNIAKGLTDSFEFKQLKDKFNEKAYVNTNFAQLICSAYEQGITFKKYTLKEAKIFCEIALRYKHNFPYALETLEKIKAYNSL